MTSRPPGPLLAAIWLGGVVLATGTGLLGVRLVADQVGDPAVPVLSSGDVSRALAASAPTATPSPTRVAPSSRPSSPVGRSAPKSFSSVGGSVGVQCRGTSPAQVYATPAQGYRLEHDELDGEEAAAATGQTVLNVRFESESSKVLMRFGCLSGNPVLLERRVDKA